MAIDTRERRASVIGLGMPVVLPVPDGEINKGDRYQLLGLYRGHVDRPAWNPVPTIFTLSKLNV